LALGAAAILDTAHAQLIPKDIEQGGVLVVDVDVSPVDAKPDQRLS
jgi:hypothetical protein